MPKAVLIAALAASTVVPAGTQAQARTAARPRQLLIQQRTPLAHKRPRQTRRQRHRLLSHPRARSLQFPRQFLLQPRPPLDPLRIVELVARIFRIPRKQITRDDRIDR